MYIQACTWPPILPALLVQQVEAVLAERPGGIWKTRSLLVSLINGSAGPHTLYSNGTRTEHLNGHCRSHWLRYPLRTIKARFHWSDKPQHASGENLRLKLGITLAHCSGNTRPFRCYPYQTEQLTRPVSFRSMKMWLNKLLAEYILCGERRGFWGYWAITFQLLPHSSLLSCSRKPPVSSVLLSAEFMYEGSVLAGEGLLLPELSITTSSLLPVFVQSTSYCCALSPDPRESFEVSRWILRETKYNKETRLVSLKMYENGHLRRAEMSNKNYCLWES